MVSAPTDVGERGREGKAGGYYPPLQDVGEKVAPK